MPRRLPLFAVVLTVAIAIGVPSATAAPRSGKAALHAAVYKELLPRLVGDSFEAYRSSCRRRSARRFSCRFRAVIIDTAWQGRGSLTYLGEQPKQWRYRLRGRVQSCSGTRCRTKRRFGWRGTTNTYG